MNVFVTGAFGKTAFSIIETLRRAGHEIVGFDLQDVPCPDETGRLLKCVSLGSIEDLNQIQVATRNVDAIVHLAVARGNGVYEHADVPFNVNVKGTYNLFEAARRNGIWKIVHMSSAAVHVRLQRGEMISASENWRSSVDASPLYDLTKRLQEEIAKEYCETHCMNAVALRAGHIVDGRTETDLKGRPLSTLEYCRAGWVCRYDLADACLKALEFDGKGYRAFHVIGSRGARDHFDVDRTEKELGLTFRSHFEQFK